MADALRNGRSLQSHDGDVVTVAGRYGVEDTGPHKVMVELPDGRYKALRKIAQIELEDGALIRLWDRPDDEMKRCDGQRVVARGRLYFSPPAPAGQAAPLEAPSLLDIERVELA